MMNLTRSPMDAWIKAKIGLPIHQDLTPRILAAHQLEKLRATLDYVKRCSPFYQRLFAAHTPRSMRCLSDLSQWPTTTGKDLRQDPLAFLCVSHSRVERVVTLPAKPGDDHPKRLFFSTADLELAVDFFHHGFSTLVAPGQRMLILLPCQKPNSVGDLVARGLARLAVSTVAHGPMQSAAAVVEILLGNSIDGMVGIPTQMAALARYAGALRVPPGQMKTIWLGTENTCRTFAMDISQFWGCPVVEHYGSAEMCPGGGVQCAARNGFHLREADLFVEIVDPQTVQPVGDGTYGEVVVTTLTREAMPLVRYRTGHRAAFLTTACPCGSVLRRMTAIQQETS